MTNALVNPMNIFLGIREPNVTFCLDISGSMYSAINSVKEQLIQYLLEQSVLAKLNLNRLFNVVAFSTDVYPWASSMVLWNTSTVNSAINWIKDLETKTGTNTLDALITAFKDDFNHSVVLVTDDISDQDPYQILNQVSLHSKGRPVHCIYITTSGRDEDRSAIEFLQNLSTVTRGFFKIVNIGRYGIEKITPINQDISSTLQLANLALNLNTSISKQTPLFSSLNTASIYSAPSFYNTFIHPKWLNEPGVYSYPSYISYPRVLVTQEGKIPSKSIAWSRFRPVKVLYDGTVSGLTLQNTNLPIAKDIAYTPDAGSLLVNKSVLARSTLNGYYYKGKVQSQILAHRFMVQFGPNNHGQYSDSFYQDTAIYDIIHYDDAMLHSIKTNDTVLALIDGKEKYAPAEVLEGFEKRGSINESDQKLENSQLTVKFSNGKTRTLPFNEAIWLPDAMYERIKFEFNLPSTARQYLEELNEEYPRKSLPGYPTQHNCVATSIECAVMPRMIYDIWPYYVPFYPLYSNILYPTVSTVIQAPTVDTSFISSFNSMSSAPVYHRSVRTRPAVVDAESVNKSIIGSVLTPDQLDEKIRLQIHNHRHLFKSRENSFDKSYCHDQINSHCSHSCYNNRREAPTQHYCNQRHFERSEETDNNHYENKYHEAYMKKMQNLYDSSKNECSCSCNCSDLKRSKSVTFSDYNSSHCESCASDYESDYDYNSNENSFNQSKSINTDISFSKKEKGKKSSKKDLNKNVPDRFGNPNVNIGLPDRPGFKTRPRSASGTFDSSIFESTSSVNLKENAKREHVARREQARLEQLQTESKKQELRDEYHRSYSNQVVELEKRRSEASFLKNNDRNLGKKELKNLTNQRFDSNKIDIEAKEQAKYANLRNQTIKRNMENLNKVQDNILKEANKLAYKKVEQDKRNQLYHDRVLVEEAFRKAQQKHVQESHNKQKSREIKRENKEEKIKSIQSSIKVDTLLKTQNNFLFPNK